MNFLNPAAFLLAILLPVIVLMYLLKLRRTERIVSSTYLWRQMTRDLEANAPWQRLRRNLLLLLQLLTLIVMILVIARPYTNTEGFAGQAAILILDTSASMTAKDIPPTRLEAAKNQIRRLIDQMPDRARITIITAGTEAQVIISSTTDRQLALKSVNEIKAGMGNSDMENALTLASAIAVHQPGTEIFVFSDGKVDISNQSSIQGALRFIPIGSANENQAIGLLNLEPAPGGASITAFAQVINYGNEPAQRRLSFYVDGQVIQSSQLDLLPHSEQGVIAEDLPIDSQIVEATLTTEASTTDFLAADDRALAIVRPNSNVEINLISQGNLFLETALALLPNVILNLIEPGPDTIYPPADLNILDAYVPVTSTLPSGNLLFIAPSRSTAYFDVEGMLDTPLPKPANEEDPLLQHVSLEDVNILDSAAIPLPDWALPVIIPQDREYTGPSSPALLFRGEIDQRRVVVISFDLHHSDLPLQVAFPLLLANTIEWLAPGYGNNVPTQVLPGEAITFFVPIGSTLDQPVASISRPDGSSIDLEAENGRIIYADTNQLGVYKLRWSSGEPIYFAVNLFSPLESSITPNETLPIAGTSQSSLPAKNDSPREWWRICALLALFLLTIEWLVYHQPALSRLYSHWFRKQTPQTPVSPH
jgi:Ca-activated chloride channel family protein